jgi:hypothetical protein
MASDYSLSQLEKCQVSPKIRPSLFGSLFGHLQGRRAEARSNRAGQAPFELSRAMA